MKQTTGMKASRLFAQGMREVAHDFPGAYSQNPEYSEGVDKRIEKVIELPEEYNELSWALFHFMNEHVKTHRKPEGSAVGYANFLAVTGAAHVGIRQSVRYASFMPFIYTAQRGNFPDVPESEDGRIGEMAAIARRSFAPVARIASEPFAISGKVEDRMWLRGEYYGNPRTAAERVNHRFEMIETESGLTVVAEIDLDEHVTFVHEKYAEDKQKVARGVGCAALNAKMDDDASALEIIWENIVNVCAADDSYFKEGLRTMNHIKDQYGY